MAASVIVAAADASDAAAMGAAIAAATQRYGGLDGVIHAAGVSGRGSVALRLSADDARAVFAPKVQGLRVLVDLLGAARLDFVALMSSINAAVGSAGACDYTSANAVLDAFADSAERPAAWQRVVSIAWGAWRDVGMAAKLHVAEALRSHWQAHLAGAIVPADGVQAFARALASGRSRIVVDTYDLVRRNELVRQPRPAADAQPAASIPSPARGDKREAPIARPPGAAAAVAPGNDIERRIAAIWSELLGIDGIGIHDDFFELGGHSLMATRVLSRIDETLGVRLALRDVFDAPTVHQLGTTGRIGVDHAAGRADRRRSGGARVLSAPALLAQLESLGVRVTADGERLRVSAAAGQLTDDLKASIAQAKPQLLALLAQRDCDRGGEFPVSFAQRRLWFLDQLEPGNSAYHLGASHRITTAIDVAAMVEAINDVVRRQDALRTVIDQAGGEPVQVVRPFEPQPVPLLDLSQLPTAQRDAEQRRLTREEATRPFDLARGPLFRAALLRLAADDHVLLFTMHHVVCDGWSLGIFLSDLHVAYEARSAGRAPAFVPLQLSYGEHATRERATLSGQTLDDLLAYWRGRLGDASPTLALPTDRPRPNRRSFEGAALNFALSPELSDGLRALARSERATLYMTLLAVFNVLLHRYSGQRDIVVGTPVANRHGSEVERVIGMFVGTLPIRSDLDPGLAWRALLRQLREHVIDAQAHSALPFEKIVDELRPERNLAWSPVYQVVFALQNAPLASAFDVTTVAAMVDLSLFMWDEPQGIRATLEYNTALFDASTAEGLRDHFCALATSVLRAPDEVIGRLDMLGTAQRECILEGWNATARPFPRDAGLPALLHAAARRRPHAVALESAHPASEVLSVTRFTYQELLEASDRLANQLCAHGVRAGDAVGLYVERSVGAVLALLAIVKAGAAYVPLDPADPVPRTLDVLRDAGIGTVITQRSLAPRLPRTDTRVLELEPLWALPAAAPAAAVVAPEADALAYVMFTSGTTGVPKGVCVTHRNVARLVCNTDYIELGPEETLLQFAPLAFDASTLEIWGALLNGARLVVHSSHVPTASDLAQTLRDHRITTLWLTAGFFHQMVESELPALAAVRQVLAGGDVLSVPHVQKLLDAKAGGVVVNGYGPTENTTFTCCHRMLPGQQLSDTVPIGRPIANTRVYLLDEHGQPVPPRVAGELFAGGDGVARGYLGAAEATASRFMPDPFDARPGSRMYRTGDLARWRADGTIEFLGRRDRQVKVRGFRVELEEVEDALRHGPGVGDAAVVARRDASGSHALVGYVVAREGGSIDTERPQTDAG